MKRKPTNKFKAREALRKLERQRRNAPFSKIASQGSHALRRDGDLMTYYHPTKGYRSRRWPRTMPTFASKIDMMQRIWQNFGRVAAAQVQAGIAPLVHE